MNLRRCCAVWVAILAAVAGTGLAGMGQEGCTVVGPWESIQVAIDSAPEGAVICLSVGAWEESLVIEKDLTLVGAGPDVTVIRGKRSEPVIAIRAPEGKAIQVHLEGLRTFGGKRGISIEGTAQATIENCTVSENVDGIELYDNAQATIQGCTVSENMGNGIELYDNSQATVRDNVIRDNTVFGIVSYSTGALVEGSGNRMEGNGCDLGGHLPSGLRLTLEEIEEEIVYPDPRFSTLQEAVDALLPGGRLILKAGEYQGGVSIDKPFTLMAEEGAEVVVVARSEDAPVFSLISGAVVELRGLTISEGFVGVVLGGTAQATIQDCTVSGNWGGIVLQDNSQATIQSCTVSENKGHGIVLRYSAQATIQGCTVSENMGNGIELYDNSQATVRDNVIRDNTVFGIVSYSTGAVVEGSGNRMEGNGCDLYGNLPSGLRLTLEEIVYPDPRFSTLQEAVDALLPGGRLILKAGEYQGGVSIDKPLTLMAEEGAEVVVVARSEDAPVFSLISGAVVELRGLTISEGFVGVALGGTAQATIQDCTVSKNSWYGIKLQDNSQATIEGCTVSGNRNGIDLSDSAQATIQNCTVSENMGNGIELYDNSQATLENNIVEENGVTGVRLYEEKTFTGYIAGKGNIIRDNGTDVYPQELGFLTTEEGGTLDRRK